MNQIYDKSEVFNEFIKIALNKTALPAPNPYQEDKKTIEEKRIPVEKHVMELAHPEPEYIANAQGDGALVENEIENQRKMIDVVNRMPTGNLIGRYAMMVDVLLKIADTCDHLEETEAADLLTQAAKTTLEKAKLPLV
jgi:hypothetical protein